jgi:hypothetical protein
MDLQSITAGDKKTWLVRGGVALASIAGLALLLPVLWAAFLASLGLLGVAIIGALGVGFMWLLPLLGQKLENQILSARKQEARVNPIEQLQNSLLKKKEQIRTTEGALGRIGGLINTMKRMLDDQAKQDPEHDLSVPRKSVEAMERFRDTNMTKLQLAIRAAKDFEREIERKQFELKFVEVGQTALASVEGAEGDAMAKLLEDEALKSVSEQFDKIFGDLEVKDVLMQAEQMEQRHSNFDAATTMIPSERRLGA